MGKDTEIITEYEVLYSVRIGVTVLVQKMRTFDCGIDVPVHFKVSPDNGRDVLISADGKAAILKDMKKEHLDAAVNRGMIMFYEMKEEEMVRCTPCSYRS